ncbi:MAG: transcriptional regulator [Proteobacteria bacterium]|nr:transcriptional regulator [Pseudomonadota bacterium]
MTTLSITARGQVTFRKEVLRHLGLKPGGKIELNLLPGGEAAMKAARPTGTFDALAGCLKGKTNGAKLSLAQIEQSIAAAGAASGRGK